MGKKNRIKEVSYHFNFVANRFVEVITYETGKKVESYVDSPARKVRDMFLKATAPPRPKGGGIRSRRNKKNESGIS